LWERTQRVSDDTTDLLLAYSSTTNARPWRDGSLRVVGGSGHIRRLPFVISLTDLKEGM
jgi:hypothetical protein